MFNKISIIGCGLIGSSILRAIKQNSLAKTISVYDKSKDVLEFIKKENICDNVTNDPKLIQKLYQINMRSSRNHSKSFQNHPKIRQNHTKIIKK